MDVDSLTTLTEHALDVVVVCPPSGGVTALSPLFGVPMIVHVLAPWVEQRSAKVFLCVEEGSAVPSVVSDAFASSLTTSVIEVPRGKGSAFTDCAILAYSARRTANRDSIVVAGNTLLNGTSLSELASYFIASEASAAVVLHEAPQQQAAAEKSGKTKGSEEVLPPQPSTSQVLCALQDESTDDLNARTNHGTFGAHKKPTLAARRLHLLQPSHAIEGLPSLTLGAVARSPSLDLSRSHSLTGVCFVKSWVLGFLSALIEEMASEGCNDTSDNASASSSSAPLTTLAKKAIANRESSPSPNTLLEVVIPALAECQHWKLTSLPHGSKRIIAKLSPADRLGWVGGELDKFLEVPHWMRERFIAHNNTSREYSSPGWDRVRVMAVLVKEPVSSCRRLISIVTREDLVALAYDVTAAFGPRSQGEPVVPPTPNNPVGSGITAIPDIVLRKLQVTNASVNAKKRVVDNTYSDTVLPLGVKVAHSCIEAGVIFEGSGIQITNSVIRAGAKVVGPIHVVNALVE